MASAQQTKAEEIIDTTEANGQSVTSDSEDEEGHESDFGIAGDNTRPSTSTSTSTPSSKKKKKKKSKTSRALAALIGKKDQEIPQEVVDRVLVEVKSKHGEGSEEANEANIRLALEHLKIMDIAKGKAGLSLSGTGKKDMGEHKVRFLYLYNVALLTAFFRLF